MSNHESLAIHLYRHTHGTYYGGPFVISREAEILIVEDNPGDVRLVEEAFQDGHLDNSLHVVTDGKEALDFVHRRSDHEDAPRPDIVLLDLTLPRVDGEEVLHEIKHHPEFGDVPVVILSGLDEDLVESRDLDEDADEDGVLEKPIEPDEFLDEICALEGFRLAIVHADDE